MTFRELSKKEVVQVDEGQCLGKIDDLVIDDKSARVEKLLMLGRPKLFGLLGRGESLVIDWDEIQKIGANAILVNTPLPEENAQEAKKPGLLGRLLGQG
ncbi:YlmC/YmxH family sporulation protein [Faecalibacterium sp. An121]|uniref:YlmC/YmxH family sporulation protein n=1 Tax=Faecalibacterium sp. An121 TaxID=1965550 RepID=UPI000B3B0326|nr:YlmC/YmxH family sporulation protein [Faecalibacterium sp. An121]OUQ40163.1 YlmC/YmxH family sporulation protein [Faecalibacterium sp. An121]